MVTWTADKDQELLKGIIQFCDIKLSGPLLQHLADIIGEGCTPKAVNHRLYNIKSTGKGTQATANTPTKNTPAKTPGTGRGRGKKNADAAEDAPSISKASLPTTGRKRGRPSKAEVEARKKVKTEDEDEIEGAFNDAVEEVAQEECEEEHVISEI